LKAKHIQNEDNYINVFQVKQEDKKWAPVTKKQQAAINN